MIRFPLMMSAALGLLLAWAAPSWSQQDGSPPPDATGADFDSLISAATDAYIAKDFGEALRLFQQAYALNPEPSLLYNMGVIADKAGDFDAAIGFLNDYVLGRDVDLDAREDALRRLEQLRKLQELRDKDKNKVVQPDPKVIVEPDPKVIVEPDPRVIAEPDPRVIAEPDPRVIVEPNPNIDEALIVLAPQPEGPSYLGPILSFSAAAALLVGGSVCALMASAQYSAFEDAKLLEERRNAAQSGENLALAADLLFASGGAVAVAALVWTLVIASDNEQDTSSLTVLPWSTSDAAGMGMKLRF